MGIETTKITVRDWAAMFSELYSEADGGRSPEQIWIAIMAHASSIGESIRKVSFKSLLHSATHTFCWVCSFLNKCGTLSSDPFSLQASLCGAVSLKYPGVCGLCQSRPCRCDPVAMEGIPNKAAHYGELSGIRKGMIESCENYDIGQFLDMFHAIYAARSHIQTLENTGFHFLEEVGEAATAVRQLSQFRGVTQDLNTGIGDSFLDGLSTVEGILQLYQKHYIDKKEIAIASRDPAMIKARLVAAKMDLVVEIGDTFSWFCGIMNKLDAILASILERPEEEQWKLEHALVKEYMPDGRPRCPTCGSNPCECVFFNPVTLPRVSEAGTS